jgi:hypothetical protein
MLLGIALLASCKDTGIVGELTSPLACEPSCGDGERCDGERGECVHAATACASDDDCDDDGTERCADGGCVECRGDDDCDDGADEDDESDDDD